MEDYFKFFPEKGIFFIDTCAFCLSHYHPLVRSEFKRKNIRYTIDYLKEETYRLRFLTDKLSGMDNWLTIQEVIWEYEKGTKKFERLQHQVARSSFVSAIGELIDQRDRTYKLLKQGHVNATSNLTDELSEKIEKLLPKVENIFRNWGGEPNEKNTDCKLISTALTYAIDMPVSIFSHDLVLLRTFAYSATKLAPTIKETYVLEEKTDKRTSTEQHLEENIQYSYLNR